MHSLKDKVTNQLTDYCCGDCGDNKWELYIGHRSDGKTELLIACTDPQCVENTKKRLGADPDTTIIWEEFDITGQGYDPMDMISSTNDDDMVN